MWSMDMTDEENIARIIVGGVTFMTESTTLKRFPNTVLSELDPSSVYYRRKMSCYFFDRNPAVFHHVLDCYRTGKLHVPPDMCLESMVDEFDFWRLDLKTVLAPCCLGPFQDYEEKRSVLLNVYNATKEDYKDDGQYNEEMGNSHGAKLFRYKLWLFMERPSSSRAAQLWTLFQIFLIYVLMFIYALMTSTWASFDMSINDSNDTTLYGWGNIPGSLAIPYYVLRFSDLAIQLFFALDLVVRLIIAPDCRHFLKQSTTLVDLLCVVSYWIYAVVYIVKLSNDTINRQNDMIMRNVVIVLQVCRLVKVIKLSSNSVQLKSLLLALRHSLKEIMILNLCFSAVMFLFAVAVYYAEYRVKESQLTDIPIAFWWALITTTTVGYGDAVPKSIAGYIVGGLCALTGILLTGLAISILANNLSTYSQLTAQQDRAQRVFNKKLRTDYSRKGSLTLNLQRDVHQETNL